MRSFIALTMVSTNPEISEIAEARAVVASYPLLKPIIQIIHDRKAYRDCLSSGHGVTEFVDDKASAEIKALMAEVYGAY